MKSSISLETREEPAPASHGRDDAGANEIVPDFCAQVVLLNREVLAFGPTAKVFTQENLERAFGGVLRHFDLAGDALHKDEDARRLTVLSDDERPLVLYGEEQAKGAPQAARRLAGPKRRKKRRAR